MLNPDNYNTTRLQALASTYASAGTCLRGIGLWGAVYYFFWASNPSAATVCVLSTALPAACLDMGIAPYFQDIIRGRMRTEEHGEEERARPGRI